MKTSLKAGLFGVLALASFAPVAQADDDAGPFTGSATLTSDYRFRGISASDRGAAVQGSVQYDHSSGLYANIWASTIDFNDEATYDSSVEVDFTAGYNHAFSDETSAGIKAVYYWYADADVPATFAEYNYWEFIANVEHDFGVASVSGEVAWSPDYFLETGNALAFTVGVAVPVLDSFAFFDGGLEASANVGHQSVEDYFAPDDGVNYVYWDVGATASWGIFAFDVRYVDTDLNLAECFGTENCEGGVVLSVTASLPE
jgi:uncharacterized protein (TIGR02001 family)